MVDRNLSNYWTPKEAAVELRVATATVRRWCRKRLFEGLRVLLVGGSRYYRIPRAAVLARLASVETVCPAGQHVAPQIDLAQYPALVSAGLLGEAKGAVTR